MEGRIIVLGVVLFVGEFFEINYEFGFIKILVVVEIIGWVVDILKFGLGGDKVFELGVEIFGVVVVEGIGKVFVDEGGIFGLGVEVCWCLLVSVSDIRELVNFIVRVGVGRVGNNDIGGNILVVNSIVIGVDVVEEFFLGDGGFFVDLVVDVVFEEVGFMFFDRFG